MFITKKVLFECCMEERPKKMGEKEKGKRVKTERGEEEVTG